MTIKYITIMIALAMALAGCKREDPADIHAEIDADMPISFGVETQEMAGTRASQPLFYYQQSMKLMGTKAFIKDITTDSSTGKKDTTYSYSTIFPFYRLQYVESSNSWEYEPDKHDSIPDTQIAKYWDMTAYKYDFVAGAPYNAVTIDNETRKFSITGLSTEGAGSSQGTITTAYLFSYPKTVDSVDFGKTVTLTFYLAMCRIMVAFVDSTGEHGQKINLTDIQFGPANNQYYYTKGNLLIEDGAVGGSSLPYHTSTVGIDSTQSPRNYQSLALPAQAAGVNGTVTEALDLYYMIPQENKDWKLTIGSLQTYKAATVPASYVRWEPAHQYTYRFVLRENSTDPNIKFIDCVRTAIKGWEAGTDDSNSVYNW